MTKPQQTDWIVDRSPVFYGWVVLFVSALSFGATMPGQTASISLFIDSLIEQLGLENRSTISALYGVGTFIAALSLTWVGMLIDRFGSRVVGVAVCILFSLALVWMSTVNSLAALLVGFVAIRGLGQGSLSLVSTTVVAQWFERLRGRALALVILGYGVIQAIYIPAVQRLLETRTPQETWLFLAGGIALGMLPILFLFMRNRPETFGLSTDGKAAKLTTGAGGEPETAVYVEESWRLRETMQLPIFWVFLAGRMMGPMFVTGMLFHQESLFNVVGFDARTAAEMIALSSILGAAFTLVSGVLVDRFRPTVVLVMELVFLIAAMALAGFMTQGWMLILWAMCLAVVQGNGGVFDGAVWPNLFGRGHQGEIRGFVTTAQVAATAAGPLLLALSFDAFGTYSVTLLIAVGVALVPLIGSFFVNAPRKRTISPIPTGD